MTDTADTYNAAREIAETAYATYETVRMAYHNGLAPDADFVAAYSVYMIARHNFEAAWDVAARNVTDAWGVDEENT